MTQINPTNQNQTSTTTDVQLECIIKIGFDFIHYKGAKEVRTEGNHITVYLNEQYMVQKKELLQKYNVSTAPYIHQFYDATIIAVKSIKQE